MAAILSGLFGRALGVKGVHIINISCLILTTLLSFIAFYEVVLCNSPVTVELFSWLSLEHLKVSWSFYFDELTVSMLIPVLIVSVLVHIYSVGYMGEDPHQQRFFAYISLFTGLMLVLVTGSNFLVMFLGWEGVGVCSYLLVHFWYTRVAAVKSAMNAMFTNRVGDYFLTIGFFVIFFTFGTLDYATVFSLAPYINTNVITFIAILLLLGAAAKSAQLGLHIWLPQAMEGWKTLIRPGYKLLKICINFYNGHTKRFIMFNRQDDFGTYFDAIIGDLLGDGHIRFHNKVLKDNKYYYIGNARMEFTFSTANYPYVRYLKFVAYSDICTISEPTPWPNPKSGKIVSQYWFSTKSLPLFTELHKNGYKIVDNKSTKIIPLNIGMLLKARGLAHLIMGDGYWKQGSVILCTDNFTFEEVELLANVITKNFGIITKVVKRISCPRPNKDPNVIPVKGKLCWRIRIIGSSVVRLREIVVPYMIPEMLYKLNIK